MRLTKDRVKALPTRDSPYFEWDDDLKGFGVKVNPSGRKVYVVQFRLPNSRRTRRMSIGPHGVLMPDQARNKAKILIGEAMAGSDPAARAAGRTDSRSVKDVAALFVSHLEQTRSERYAKEVHRSFERDVIPTIGQLDIKRVDQECVRQAIGRVVDKAPVMANRLISMVSSMLSWAEAEGYVDTNPAFKMRRVAAEDPRERILSDQELVAVWSAAPKMGYPWGPFAHLLLLTGARRDEVAAMPWSELDLEKGVWTLHRSRVKNRSPHVIPLVSEAVAILGALERDHELVFTTTGTTPVSGFSNAQLRLHSLSETGDWCFHDIRRTFRTSLSRLGVIREVAERLIGHRQGGLIQIYDQYDYLDEKRAAIERYVTFLMELIETKSD